MSKNLASNIVNLVLLLMGVGLFISAQGIETGAAMAQGGDFMPKLCSGIWMVLGILLFLFGLREKPAEGGGQVSLKGFGATLALLLVYVLLLKPVGFVITSIVYLFLQMCLFVPAEKRTKKNYILFAVISVVMPFAVNWLFVNVFALILPAGILK